MALFLKTQMQISLDEAHICSSLTVSYHPFSLKFGKNGAPECGNKAMSGSFSLLPPSKAMSI